MPIPGILAIMLGIFGNQFKCIYLKKPKSFLNILLHFQNSKRILNILNKKLGPIAKVFLELSTPKNVDTWMHRRSCVRTPFGSQQVNRSQTLESFAKANVYPSFPSFWLRWNWKMSSLVRSEILGLYVNPLFAVARYCRYNTGTFPQLIQMHLP